jgi:hypothetical protein
VSDVYVQSEWTAQQKQSYKDGLLYWQEVFHQTLMSQDEAVKITSEFLWLQMPARG